MMKLTEKPYKCVACGEVKPLVIVRGRAIRCEDCRENHLTKLKVLRELNKMVGE